MLISIISKLTLRSNTTTSEFYLNQLGFTNISNADFNGYLINKKESIEIHFFEFKDLDPTENYGQVYIRTNNI